MSYATLAQFKAAVGITDTTDDSALQNVLDATDTLIDLHCDRKTGFGTASETRYYTPEAFNYVLVDDLVSVTTLQTDDNADGTYETTWSSATDYKLAPINYALDGWPYDRIETSVSIPRSFPKTARRAPPGPLPFRTPHGFPPRQLRHLPRARRLLGPGTGLLARKSPVSLL